MLSLVIPVYRNEESLPRLLEALTQLSGRLGGDLEVVFVVDGSPDRSYEVLKERLTLSPLRAQLVSLSRNFGSFAAIAAGFAVGAGEYFAVLAADLQEPPELIAAFYEELRSGNADIVFGHRSARADPWLSQLASDAFWNIYRWFVMKDMPKGGVDVFGCTRPVRDHLLALPEIESNMVALLFWLGFRRKFVPYERRARQEGKSAWTAAKKLRYAVNSIFNFTDLPIRLLFLSGFLGVGAALTLGTVVLIMRLIGAIQLPGYAPIVLLLLFFGGLMTLGLAVLGQYLWLSLLNVRRRPSYIIASVEENRGDVKAAADHFD